MPSLTESSQIASSGVIAGPLHTGAAVDEAGGTITVDTGAIVANWRELARVALPAECSAVVKADAYGCGIEPVVSALAAAGCKTFFVAHLDEARRTRAAAPQAVIYTLNGLVPGTGPLLAELNVRPVIGSMVELAEWDAFVSTSGWRGSFALHVDTGMNRLGIAVSEAAALSARIRLEHHGIALVMSHLACAETPGHALNQQQIALFREVRLLFRGVPSSLANSSGIFLGAVAHCDLVRPGVALYGSNPTPSRANPMRAVVEMRARIVQVRTAQRGDSVGYGATWSAKRATKLAIVSAGYADGYPRGASASDSAVGGHAIIAGKRCPLAGRVSMDLLAVDISEVPDGAARRGDEAVLLGGDIGIDEVAAAAKLIPYEVLTGLSRRMHRVYRGS